MHWKEHQLRSGSPGCPVSSSESSQASWNLCLRFPLKPSWRCPPSERRWGPACQGPCGQRRLSIRPPALSSPGPAFSRASADSEAPQLKPLSSGSAQHVFRDATTRRSALRLRTHAATPHPHLLRQHPKKRFAWTGSSRRSRRSTGDRGELRHPAPGDL